MWEKWIKVQTHKNPKRKGIGRIMPPPAHSHYIPLLSISGNTLRGKGLGHKHKTATSRSTSSFVGAPLPVSIFHLSPLKKRGFHNSFCSASCFLDTSH